jgi:hypothetical protein
MVHRLKELWIPVPNEYLDILEERHHGCLHIQNITKRNSIKLGSLTNDLWQECDRCVLSELWLYEVCVFLWRRYFAFPYKSLFRFLARTLLHTVLGWALRGGPPQLVTGLPGERRHTISTPRPLASRDATSRLLFWRHSDSTSWRHFWMMLAISEDKKRRLNRSAVLYCM